MSTISIYNDTDPASKLRYRAIAGDRQVFGATRGQALDALTAEWGDKVQETVILIERFDPDMYFTEEEQRRK